MASIVLAGAPAVAAAVFAHTVDAREYSWNFPRVANQEKACFGRALSYADGAGTGPEARDAATLGRALRYRERSGGESGGRSAPQVVRNEVRT